MNPETISKCANEILEKSEPFGRWRLCPDKLELESILTKHFSQSIEQLPYDFHQCGLKQPPTEPSKSLDEIAVKWADKMRESTYFKVEDEIKQACLEYNTSLVEEVGRLQSYFDSIVELQLTGETSITDSVIIENVKSIIRDDAILRTQLAETKLWIEKSNTAQYAMEPEAKLAEAQKSAIKFMLNIHSEFHGCLTGDCPHTSNDACIEHLIFELNATMKGRNNEMSFEPIIKFWLAKTNAELAAENSRLKSWLLAAAVVAVFGWALFFCRIAQ